MSNVIHSEEQKKTHKVKERKLIHFLAKILSQGYYILKSENTAIPDVKEERKTVLMENCTIKSTRE